MMLLVDHDEGKEYLEKGLELVKNGNIDGAVEALVKAAITFERTQDFRQISALWRGIAKLLELKLKDKEQEDVPPISEWWPLTYSTIKLDEWEKQKDTFHRLAWVYQWSGEHQERASRFDSAYKDFIRAAENAEQTKTGKEYPGWPGKLYCKAVHNYIRAFGTTDEEEIRGAIKKMEINYLKIKDKVKSYKQLAAAYRLLKSQLIEAGNLTEPEEFRKKECSALMHYYFYSGRYFRAVAEWLAESGFLYFLMGLFLIILVIFPYIYYQYNFITSVQGKITYYDAILYSVESALNVGHNEIYAIGYGKILNVFEAVLSWLGLGVFIWWLTRRLER